MSLYDAFLWGCNDKMAARCVSAAVFLLVMGGLYVWYSRRDSATRGRALYLVAYTGWGAFLLLTPVLHPWYVCWIVPFLVIIPNRAWIFFTGAVFLSYLVLKGYVATGVWEEDALVKLAQYFPFYGFLLYDSGRWLAQRIRNKTACFLIMGIFNHGV